MTRQTSATAHQLPRADRCLGIGIVGIVAGLILAAIQPAPSAPSEANLLIEWWDNVGTPNATVMVVRMLGLALAGWTVAISMAGIVAALSRSVIGCRLWRLLTPAQAQRALAAGTIVIAASTPSLVLAADDVEVPEFVLVDMGPAVPDGATIDTEPGRREAPEAVAVAATAEQWTVAPGDHLWRVAEETLQDRGHVPDETEIVRYWKQLIESNRDVIGDDPDLILPGQVLTLPPM